MIGCSSRAGAVPVDLGGRNDTGLRLLRGFRLPRHHPTGRSMFRAYFDIALTVFACAACNVADFKAWRAAAIDDIEDPSVTRLRHLAFFAPRLGGQERPVALPPGFWRALTRSLVNRQGRGGAIGLDLLPDSSGLVYFDLSKVADEVILLLSQPDFAGATGGACSTRGRFTGSRANPASGSRCSPARPSMM